MSVPLRSSVVVTSGASGSSLTVTLPSGIVNDDTVTIALLQDIGGTAITQHAGTTGWPNPPEINIDLLWVVITGLLGIGGLRTYEKRAGVAK